MKLSIVGIYAFKYGQGKNFCQNLEQKALKTKGLWSGAKVQLISCTNSPQKDWGCALICDLWGKIGGQI